MSLFLQAEITQGEDRKKLAPKFYGSYTILKTYRPSGLQIISSKPF